MNAPISIIIPAHNQLEFCQRCVHSIRVNTRRPYKLILVDNASTDGVAEFFDSVPDATAVHAECNRGFAGGINLGLGHAEGHTVLLNSDTLVPEGWLDRLEAALLSSEDIGMVGPMSNSVSGCQQIEGLQFTSLEEIDAYAAQLAESKAGQLRDVSRLVGFCLLIRDKVIGEVGPFDESYGIGNFEDDDYCVRVHLAGYRLCVAEDAFVFHYGGVTFASLGYIGGKWDALLEENARKFRKKWQGKGADSPEAVAKSEELNARARQCFEEERTAEAIRLLKEAIETAPRHGRNYNDLGAALWSMGRHQKAYDNFIRALNFDPANADARQNLCDAAQVLGREASAKAFIAGLDEDEKKD